ncbi:MAG TPA: cyclase family protein [Terriglobales bacterium]|nr:cyclase family protein [Terriglobales bacterium]
MPSGFRAVVDLTHTINDKVPPFSANQSQDFKVTVEGTLEKNHVFVRKFSMPEHYGTHIDAPAHFAKGLWTVDQIPAERLIAPMVVLDIRKKTKADADYQLSVQDIADWEQIHGQIPGNAVVMLDTGWDAHWNSAKEFRNADAKGVMHFPGYSVDAAKFLTEARAALGLGIDTLSVDYGAATDFPVHQFTMSRSVYHLEDVANLDRLPATGSTVIVAPIKLEGGSGGPVRLLALVR